MDIFGLKKRKREKDFNKEINIAIGAEIERFGSANQEHFKSSLELARISESKINPDHAANNYHQQAGFSAEVKTEARVNAENKINKTNTRIRRTDDVGSVNHPEYDHIEVDQKGNPILDINGGFTGGSQQKVFKNVNSYRDLYNKEFDHYKSAILDVPSDQINDIRVDWDNQIKSLEKQKSTMLSQGKTEKATELNNKIDNIKDAKSRLRDSKVSTADAMEARKNYKLSVAKDLAKVSHKAGVESAKFGAAFGGGISTIKNVSQFSNGDISGSEAVKSIAVDTTVAASTAYASGATTAMVTGALKNSSNELMKNISKGSTPALIVQTGRVLANQTLNLITGKVNANEFVENIGKEGVALSSSIAGANLGSVVGTLMFPGVGTIVGGVIGGMTASILSGSLYHELKKSVNDTKLSNEQRVAVKAYCEKLIIQEREYREQMMSIYDSYFDRKELDISKGFEDISIAIQNGEDITDGLKLVANAFNAEIEFNNLDEFKKHIKGNRTLEL